MKQLDKSQIEKNKIMMLARGQISLKHQINRYEEMQTKLPTLDKSLDDAITTGKGKKITVTQVLELCWK